MRTIPIARSRTFEEPRTIVPLTLSLTILAGLIVLAGCDPQPSMESTESMESMESMEADAPYEPQFTRSGEFIQPPNEIWREWPQVGTPLTPNALNGGEAPFPEFHSVYIDPVSWTHWRATGEFREGTVLVKELVSVRDVDAMPDGSTIQVSGRGYFMGEFIGFEIAHKSAARYPNEPGNWAYYTFGHHPQPYAASAARSPVSSCNSCHQASAAQDYVFTQFYPVLRASKPGQ